MLQTIDYHAILPELILIGAAVVVLVADLWLPQRHKWLGMPLALLGVIGSFVALMTLVDGDTRETFCLGNVGVDACSYVVDDFAIIFKAIFLGSAVVVLLLSLNYFREGRYYQGEYYFLLLCSFFGMLTMASSRDLIMLFGMSLLYGMTGSVQLEVISRTLETRGQPGGFVETPAMAAAVALIIVGFAFKVSAAPFHFWAPDTYHGAPIPVAAFLSVASKAAGFTGLMVVCFVGLRPYADVWGPLLAVLAAITMTLGNLVAMQQRHMVRLLAYSSVAQAGYMLVPLGVAATAVGRSDDGVLEEAFRATIGYIAIYAILNLGVFACVVAVARRTPRNLLVDYRGLVKTSPVLAAVIAFFMLGLAGAPPALAGLFAKIYVFQAAINGDLLWLAVVMAVNTVIAMYYYLRVAFTVFAGIGETSGEAPLGRARIPAPVVAAIAITAIAAVVISFAPELLLRYDPALASP